MMQDYDRAEQIANKSISRFKAEDDTGNLGGPVSTMGRIAFDRGHYSAALKYFQEALALFQAVVDKPGESITLSVLGQLTTLLGDFDNAEKYIFDAANIDNLLGDPTYEVYLLRNRAEIVLQRKEFADAQAICKHAIHLLQDFKLENLKGEVSAIQGQALEMLGDQTGAQNSFRNGCDIGPLYSAVLPSLAGLARLHMDTGDLSSALAIVEKIIHKMDAAPFNGKDDPFPIYLTCYNVFLAADEKSRAQSILKSAHNVLLQRSAAIDDERLMHQYVNLTAQRTLIQIDSQSREDVSN